LEEQEINNIRIVPFDKFYKRIIPSTVSTKDEIILFNSSAESDDNAFPNKLLDLKALSSIHNNLIEMKANLIASTGLYPVDDSNQALIAFLNKKNGAGESHNKVVKKVAFDLSLHEQAFVEVIYDGNKIPTEMYHKPVTTMRAGEVNDYGVPDYFYYSDTFGLIENTRDKRKRNDYANAIKLPAFNPEKVKKNKGQILHIKKYSGDDCVYPTPSYMSAEYWIMVTHEIASYVLNKFINGYFIDGFLYINSNLPEEQQKAFIQEFANKHKGSKGKKIIFVFGNTAVSKPEFVPIQDSLTNSVFKEFMGEATKQIVWAHGASLEQLSLSNSDSFGSTNPDSNDINVSRLKYINDVIKSYQEVMLESFNSIFEAAGLGQATVLNETLKLTIPELQPSDTTEDERREINLGLPPKAAAPVTNPTPQTPVG